MNFFDSGTSEYRAAAPCKHAAAPCRCARGCVQPPCSTLLSCSVPECAWLCVAPAGTRIEKYIVCIGSEPSGCGLNRIELDAVNQSDIGTSLSLEPSSSMRTNATSYRYFVSVTAVDGGGQEATSESIVLIDWTPPFMVNMTIGDDAATDEAPYPVFDGRLSFDVAFLQEVADDAADLSLIWTEQVGGRARACIKN